MLANLAWVVVDEAHVYRGVFGLACGQRASAAAADSARAYGAEPRFLLTSATIANPLELPRTSPAWTCAWWTATAPPSERQTVMWNPPLVDESWASGPRAVRAAGLLSGLVEREVRTICFLRSRRGVELIQRFTRLRLRLRPARPGRPDRALPRGLHPHAAS